MTFSPIHIAVLNDDYDLVLSLLEEGADVNSRTNEGGDTPLVFATLLNYQSIVRLLLEWKANSKIGNKVGQTPLHIAVDQENSEMVDILQGNPRIRDCVGNTPLHLAAMKNNADIVKKLIDLGANPRIVNLLGDVAIELVPDSKYSPDNAYALLFFAYIESPKPCKRLYKGRYNDGRTQDNIEDNNISPTNDRFKIETPPIPIHYSFMDPPEPIRQKYNFKLNPLKLPKPSDWTYKPSKSPNTFHLKSDDLNVNVRLNHSLEGKVEWIMVFEYGKWRYQQLLISLDYGFPVTIYKYDLGITPYYTKQLLFYWQEKFLKSVKKFADIASISKIIV